MSLPNYSFTVNKSALDYISDKTDIKPVELYKKAEEMEIEDYRLWMCHIVKNILGKRFPKTNREINFLMDRFEDYYGFYHSFIRSKHFCVKSLPDEYSTRTLSKDVINFDSEIFIDFNHKGVNCCLDFYKRKLPFYIGNNLITHNILLYVDRPDCYTCKGGIDTIRAMFVVNVHISEDGRMISMELCRVLDTLYSELFVKDVPYSLKAGTNETYDHHILIQREKPVFPSTNNLKLRYVDLPDRDTLFGLINYAVDCYKVRKTINRSNVKMNKHYKQHEIHMSDSKEMKYIPLVQYYKEYEPRMKREHQGGHHASPCEHERSGHFRRTKKHTGSYNLVNGEFVKVEAGTGEFTMVRPSHVKGNKDSKINVYKI